MGKNGVRLRQLVNLRNQETFVTLKMKIFVDGSMTRKLISSGNGTLAPHLQEELVQVMTIR